MGQSISWEFFTLTGAMVRNIPVSSNHRDIWWIQVQPKILGPFLANKNPKESNQNMPCSHIFWVELVILSKIKMWTKLIKWCPCKLWACQKGIENFGCDLNPYIPMLQMEKLGCPRKVSLKKKVSQKCVPQEERFPKKCPSKPYVRDNLNTPLW